MRENSVRNVKRQIVGLQVVLMNDAKVKDETLEEAHGDLKRQAQLVVEEHVHDLRTKHESDDLRKQRHPRGDSLARQNQISQENQFQRRRVPLRPQFQRSA